MLSYSLGELVDKLVVIHLKLWHIEERIAEENADPKEIERLCDQVINLNTTRNKIIDSLNEQYGRNDG